MRRGRERVMKKILVIIAAVGIFGGSAGMNSNDIDWCSVAAKTQTTSLENPPCSSAIKFLEGNPSVDWGDIEQSALDGEPVSQYCMALKCDSLAKIRYNGERKKLRRSEIMFLLLSSKKGNYEKANVALTPLLSSEIEVDLEDVKQMNLIVDQILATIDKGK